VLHSNTIPAGQNRPTTDLKFLAKIACQRLATTTGIAISVTALCAGSTSAIMGTVSKGVPTPNVPFIRPPQKSANEHQSRMPMESVNDDLPD